jgi:macrodomain Ter protein organizer (MatP/YcbG family)
VQDRRRTHAVPTKATIKIDMEVHAWLSLLAEKYDTTLSGVIYKLVTEHEPEIVQLQSKIEALKQAHLNEGS